MIAFYATPELKLTFEKMIRTMEVKVKWNGLFVVIDNTMILQGELRSIFFHLDNRKVITNVIDLDVPVQKISRIENNEAVKNVINMLLYAFGKWGTIKGLKVEKDYQQLGILFENILSELNIEPEYTKERFCFYQNGMKIVYEDVMQCAIDSMKQEHQQIEEESVGLWHKLVWNQKYEDFSIQETTLSERNRNRLGNNFYLTNYLCPSCGKKMHGVIYPIGQEFVIDTKEGRVQIARAYTCSICGRFYTPRPKRLLIDGDCYIMEFGGDKSAYQDYQELLGKNGAKVCNPNYNQYLDQMVPKNTRRNDAIAQKMAEREATEELYEMLEEIDDLPSREFHNFFAKVAEGFFPEKEIGAVEDALWKKYEARERGEKTSGGIKGHEKKSKQISSREEKNSKTEQEKKAAAEKMERYKKRLELFPRLSDRQRMELIRQISFDTSLPEEIKNQLLEVAKTLKLTDNFNKLKEKIADAKNKNRIVMLHIYEEIDHAELKEEDRDKLFELTGIKLREYHEYLEEKEEDAVYRRNRGEDIIVQPKETGRRRVEEVNDWGEEETIEYHRGRIREEGNEFQGGRSGEERERASYRNGKIKIEKTESSNQRENGQLGESKTKEEQQTVRENDRSRSTSAEPFLRKKLDFSGADRAVQIREIESMIRQTKSSGREDLYQLWEELLNRGFDEETLEPYAEHVKAQIQKLDEEYLDSLIGNLTEMTSEEGVEAYEKIKEANILPELKLNTMRQLEKRLAKVKAEECDLLVQKLQREMDEAHVANSDRHHFYPAKKVFLKEATEEEVEVIDYAKAAYGAGIGMFEYPIFAVDISRNRSGEKGFFLTPEYLYYSTLTTSYCMSVFSIEKFGVLTGLLNRGFYVYQKNGEKTKLPSALEVSELPKFAEVLTSYVKYLQEKPFSRKEAYLTKEQHEEICCFRCGYVYRGKNTCPKCGYKANR